MKRFFLIIAMAMAAYSAGAKVVGPEVVIPAPVSASVGSSMIAYNASKCVVIIKNVGKGKLSRECKGLPASAQEGAYKLQVRMRNIKITANTELGYFYAMQTLNQMLGRMSQDEEPTNTHISCCTVFDYPRFAYRGLMFDTSRHLRSKEFIFKQLDAMALVKMNVLHLHLTDDEGWRIQIDRYPQLTEFASHRWCLDWNTWRQAGRHLVPAGTPGAYGGWYTKEDLREIVEYAAERNIEVIPEIEMPGHSAEVLKTFPELACTSLQYSIEAQKDRTAERDRKGELKDPKAIRLWDLCPGKESTFEFLENVLEEVMEIFPSKYVHIGGDEAIKKAWDSCEDCQRRMKEEGMTQKEQLQSYLVQRIEKFVNAHGKRIIGWNEILQGGLAPNATVMSWQGTKGGIKAIGMGHDVIMTPEKHCYLDRYQDDPANCPRAFGSYVPIDTVYSFNPMAGIDPEGESHLLGLQGNLWAEFIPTDSQAEYMIWPRAFALSEVGWSQMENKDPEYFRKRAIAMSDLFVSHGYNVFDLRKEMGPPSYKVTEAY